MAALTINSTVAMNDSNRIPLLGFGVFQLDDPAVCEAAVSAALQAGYRHIDTALKYGNEQWVGRAIAASDVAREEIFLTTKATFDHDPEAIRAGLADSLRRLQTEYVDLFLIHWPMDDQGLPGAWETLQQLQADGRCRSIGVSNITVRRFEEVVFRHSERVPAVNQIELHVYNQQTELVEYCLRKGMVVEAYSAIAQGKRLARPGEALAAVAASHNKSVAQVMLRFLVQQGIVTLVKSATPARIRENIDIFDFELDDGQMAALRGLDEGLFVREWAPEGYY